MLLQEHNYKLIVLLESVIEQRADQVEPADIIVHSTPSKDGSTRPDSHVPNNAEESPVVMHTVADTSTLQEEAATNRCIFNYYSRHFLKFIAGNIIYYAVLLSLYALLCHYATYVDVLQSHLKQPDLIKTDRLTFSCLELLSELWIIRNVTNFYLFNFGIFIKFFYIPNFSLLISLDPCQWDCCG